MTAHLRLGLLESNLYWEQILNQEGLSYSLIKNPSDNLNPDHYPILLIHSNSNEARLLSYLQSGGCIVLDFDSNDFFSCSIQNHPRTVKVRRSVKKILGDKRSTLKQFSAGEKTFVTETVALERKSEIRQVAVEAIKLAFWKKNLPYAHLWYYPSGYESAFNFRFDLDEFDPQDFTVMCALVEKYLGSITCFPCMKTYESLTEPLSRLSAIGPEIGSHSYVHHVYSSYEQNLKNISKAEALLSKFVPEITAFAGPHGKWHPTLQRILEEKKYCYSSEFGLDYDNFPFYPILSGRKSSVLQIPVHPICEGVFLERHGYQPDLINNYYAGVIEYKKARHEPIFIFGHPTRRIGRYPDILHHLYRCIEGDKKVWRTELREFYSWWKERESYSWTPQWENGNLKLLGTHEKIWIETIFPDQKQYLAPADKLDYLIPSVSIKESQSTLLPNSPVKEKIHPLSFLKKIRLAVKAYLDWEIKTPIKDLEVRSLSQFIKYAIRLIHDLPQFLASR